MRAPWSTLWKRDEASNLVEFSLIAFMFIIILLSVVEMGRMILVYTTMANAARAGARYAIVHGADRTGTGSSGPSSASDYSQITTVVKNFASAGLVNTSNMNVSVSYLKGDATVCPANGSNAVGCGVTVTVTYPYDPLIGYFNSILGTATLGSTSEGVITF